MSAFARRTEAGWLLRVHAQPGAKRSEVAGVHGEALKVRIAAPALDGRANAALEDFIAARLGVPRAKVQVVRGPRSRDKQVLVADEQAEVERLLA